MKYKQISIDEAWAMVCIGAPVERKGGWQEDLPWMQIKYMYGGYEAFYSCYSDSLSKYVFRIPVE